MVTDQTSAHDELDGSFSGVSVENSEDFRKNKPKEYIEKSFESMVGHCKAILELQKGVNCF